MMLCYKVHTYVVFFKKEREKKKPQDKRKRNYIFRDLLLVFRFTTSKYVETKTYFVLLLQICL